MRKSTVILAGFFFLSISMFLSAQTVAESGKRLVVCPPISGQFSLSAKNFSAPTVPSDTQPSSVAFGEQVGVWTVWYINTENCTNYATGSITASDGPNYGTVTTTMGSLPLPLGYPCAGVVLPETTAYYTWNVVPTTSLVDFFSLLYTATNGVTASKDVQPELVGKSQGDCCGRQNVGTVPAGDPINVGTGNVFEQVTDYETAGQNKLSFIRYYNSLGVPNTFASALGVNWRTNYDRYVNIISPELIIVERPDGQLLNFTGPALLPDADVDYTAVNLGSTWTVTDHNDTMKTYTPLSATEILLESIKLRNGYTQTLAYNASNQLASVMDSYGRQLLFTYNGTALNTVTTPDGLILTFAYTTIVGGTDNQLASVSYNTTPVTSQQYQYSNTALPFALTSVIDEDGNTLSSWTYDQFGRGLTSQMGNGADLTRLPTMTRPGIVPSRMRSECKTPTILEGAPKVSEIDRALTGTTAAAIQLFTYDANGISQVEPTGTAIKPALSTTHTESPRKSPNRRVRLPSATIPLSSIFRIRS